MSWTAVSRLKKCRRALLTQMNFEETLMTSGGHWHQKVRRDVRYRALSRVSHGVGTQAITCEVLPPSWGSTLVSAHVTSEHVLDHPHCDPLLFSILSGFEYPMIRPEHKPQHSK